MPSLVYTSMASDMAEGRLDFSTSAFKVLLVNGYTPDKEEHMRRSDVTGEAAGAGYTAGGEAVEHAVTDTADQTDIHLGGATWPASTIAATGAIYYHSRGIGPENDELVCYVDFGGVISSLAGAFTLQPSVIQIHNP